MSNENDNKAPTMGEVYEGEEHYGLPVVDRDGHRYAYAEDDAAADDAARLAILDRLWAFRSEFLRDYVPALRHDGARKAFDAMRKKLCGNANDLVRSMIGDRLDEMVADAIGADGRGHFLSRYDGHEVEEGDAYLYRIG